MVKQMIDEYDILNYVYKNAKMGSDSTNTLLKSLENKDNNNYKLKNLEVKYYV